MAGGIQKVGETGLEVTLGFRDAKARGDFELAFRAWLQQRKREIVTEEIVGALAQQAAEDAGQDVSGYLFTTSRVTKSPDGKTTVTTFEYWDFLPVI